MKGEIMEIFERELTEKIIGSAISVHKELGPGLLESIYESCLCYEFDLIGLQFKRQKEIPIFYKDKQIDSGIFRIDLIVENKVIIELKSVESILPVHEAQLLTYLRLTKIKAGLLINFNVAVLKQGIRRMVL